MSGPTRATTQRAHSSPSMPSTPQPGVVVGPDSPQSRRLTAMRCSCPYRGLYMPAERRHAAVLPDVPIPSTSTACAGPGIYARVVDVDRAGRTDLHYAALEGRLDDLRAALAAGQNPSMADKN